VNWKKTISEISANMKNLQMKYDEAKANLDELAHTIAEKESEIIEITKSINKLESENKYLTEKIETKNNEYEELIKSSKITFENTAARLFEDNSLKFSNLNREQIESILNPLKENIKEFREKVEQTYDRESKERFSLQDRVKELMELNRQISSDATNLTKALKGEVKTQGNWGEMILEKILEHSGLRKGVEYLAQDSYTDENGKRKQPDITINYPDERVVIIDSKVSLIAYEKYVNSDDTEEQKVHLKNHITSVKNHIDNLSGKDYGLRKNALDFVMLFVPVEPAYIAAIQNEATLWNYAYERKILLISPTNLIAALKLIADIWKREHQNQNALEIAKRGGQMLEKFSGFINDMNDIKSHIDKLSEVHINAMKKLSQGKGNLLSQAQKLEEMGVKTKKAISEPDVS
jgi:DNA recombination protein RmuC